MKKLNPIIEIKQLSTQMGSRLIHDQLDLKVYPGEVLVLVGGSGSGKTVLLQEMIALRKPNSGSIRIFDQELVQIHPKDLLSVQRRWGVLFQQNALFNSLTVLQNILFPLKEHLGLTGKLAVEIALLKLKLAGLPLEAALRYPSELSGGMQKRAAFARALALDPELIFLDEPTAGLDPGLVAAFDRLILNLQKTTGLTVVVVTHDILSIQRIATRIAFLADKKVIAIGPPHEVMSNQHSAIKNFFSEV